MLSRLRSAAFGSKKRFIFSKSAFLIAQQKALLKHLFSLFCLCAGVTFFSSIAFDRGFRLSFEWERGT